MLSNTSFVPLIEEGTIGLEGWDGKSQPASIDVRLDSRLIVEIDRFQDPFDVFLKKGNGTKPVTLEPGMFALGSTIERLRVPDHMAVRFEGKSTLARQGLFPHHAAGFIDPGFEGQITLELICSRPRGIKLEYGMAIGQICFYRLDRKPLAPYGHPMYGSKYQGQSGPTPARMS